MTIDRRLIACAACGYPTLGPDVCYYCRPLVASALTPFRRSPAGPMETTPEASVFVRTTARRPHGPRADAKRSFRDSAASTFPAAG